MPGLDKLAHLGLFGLLAATARWRWGATRVVAAALFTYAVASELVQGLLLADRSGDPLDVVADLFGAAAGWLLAGWLLEGRAVRRARRSGAA